MMTELGAYGGVARRAFKLKDVGVKAGDPVTVEMLEGLSLRHIKSLGGSGLVEFYNQAPEAKVSEKEVSDLAPKLKQAKKRGK